MWISNFSLLFVAFIFLMVAAVIVMRAVDEHRKRRAENERAKRIRKRYMKVGEDNVITGSNKFF